MKTKLTELANNLRSSRDAHITSAKDYAYCGLDGDTKAREYALQARARAEGYDHAWRCVLDLIDSIE